MFPAATLPQGDTVMHPHAGFGDSECVQLKKNPKHPDDSAMARYPFVEEKIPFSSLSQHIRGCCASHFTSVESSLASKSRKK